MDPITAVVVGVVAVAGALAAITFRALRFVERIEEDAEDADKDLELARRYEIESVECDKSFNYTAGDNLRTMAAAARERARKR